MRQKVFLGIVLLSALITACGMNPESDGISSENVSSLVEEGTELLESGDLLAASEMFCEAMEKNPKDISARIGAAKVQIQRGNYASAERSIQMAMKIQPDEREIYETYMMLGEAAGDEGYYRRLTTLARNYQQRWFEEEYVSEEPKADLEPGLYQEKIQVSLEAEEGTEIVYELSVNGQYQSMMSYHDPITLRRGLNILTAYAVKDGVPGKSITLEYECDYPPEVIVFEDPVVEMLIRYELGIDSGDITDVDCERIEEISTDIFHNMGLEYKEIQELKIHSLEDLKHMPNLYYVHLNEQTEIEDWSVLRVLPLSTLDINRCGLKNLDFVTNMQNLYCLYVSDNEIQDISALRTLGNLEYISVDSNPIQDMSPIIEMKYLQSLEISGDQITDLEWVVQLPNLTRLRVWEGSGLNYEILGQMKNLTYLNLQNCDVQDISFVKELTNLERLYLQNTQVDDVSPIFALKNLTYLSIYRTPVSEDEILELQMQIPNCEINYYQIY